PAMRLLAAFFLAPCFLAFAQAPEPSLEWADVPAILSRIEAPRIPRRDFVVTRYGAVGDGRTDSRPALRAAIAACHKAGGGRVVAPARVFYLRGPIELLGQVELHLEAKAVLRFSGRPEDFLPLILSRWEGT